MRVKTGTVRTRKHKKLLSKAKGYWMTRSKHYKTAHEAVMHAGQYAFNGRRIRRRDMRKLWIIRVNALLKQLGVRYSIFINKLKQNNILLNRKVLSELAINHPDAFKAVVEKVK